MKITLKEKDITTPYSDSGTLIDELAYSAGQYTENDVYESALDYEPSEPYMFNFESDLLANTKTDKQLYDIAGKLGISLNANITRLAREAKLQCGAWIALNNDQLWSELLEKYTEKVKEGGTDDNISEKYATDLHKERDEYQKDQYKEWLYGDHQNWSGILVEIAKFYGASEALDYDEKKQEVTFTFDDEYLQVECLDSDAKLTIKNAKEYLLSEIKSASENRYNKEKADREKRKIERERLATYKAEQAKKADEARKTKLLSMTLIK